MVSSPQDRNPEGVVRVRAPNTSAMTLDGTNTYVVGGWVVDPGPAHQGHLQAVRGAVDGPIEGIVLTHSHPDHADGAEPQSKQLGGVPVVLPRDGQEVGPFRTIATPGHAPDHVSLLAPDGTCFVGDLVMGEGSVFIDPGEGSISDYLASLRTLRGLDLEVLCPGHGPYVWDPRGKLDQYLAHRLERERLLLDALAAGARTEEELLDRAWSDAPAALRPAAALTLRAHLHKLAEEGRLPNDLAEALL